MENYLVELIKENNRIIIPNFGAFIISREKGQNILFNNFLSFNDGLLISHICAVEGVDSATATEKVEAYVNTINSSLDNDGSFTIKGIGVFIKDQNGVLRFEQENPPAAEADQEEQKNKLVDSASSDEEEDLLDLDTTIIAKEEEKKHTKKQDFTSPPPVQTASPDLRITHQETQKEKEKIELHQENTTYTKETIIKKRGFIWPIWLIALLIILFLLGVALYLWFFTPAFNALKDRSTENTIKIELPVQEELDIQEETEISDEEIFLEEQSSDEEVSQLNQALTAAPGTRQHHVIIGSFKNENAAIKMMNQMLEKGFRSTTILPYQGRFLVSFEWHNSVNKALQRQEELLGELKIENWVLSLTVK